MDSFAEFASGTADVAARNAHDASSAAADNNEEFELGFLPATLVKQCRSLIESYHEVHGFACLPDVLWKFRLGPFIQRQRELRQWLKKASTTRSAKRANEGFVQITTAILSLEILASSFAGWSAIYPEAGEIARSILKRHARGPHMPLMEFYLYPPKHISPAAIATLMPPARRQSDEATLYRESKPELSGERLALGYAKSVRDAREPSPARFGTASVRWRDPACG
jgi:hypothetical protein